MNGVYRPVAAESARGIASGAAVGVMKLLWAVIRLPPLLVLVILEPVISALCGALALLGILATIFFSLVGPPHFPWVTMSLISLGFALVLVPYYGLIRLLSR